jgi:hypothetical protein
MCKGSLPNDLLYTKYRVIIYTYQQRFKEQQMKQFHYHAFYTPNGDEHEPGWVSGDMELDDQYSESDVVEMLQENEHCRLCWVVEIDQFLNEHFFDETLKAAAE